MKKLLIAMVGAALFSSAGAVQAQDSTKHFDGAYVGADAGYIRDNDGTDDFYYGLNLGFRKQTDSNLVFGVEGNFGQTSIEDINIDHWTALGSVGWAFGEENRNLFSLGGGYVLLKASYESLSDTGDAYAAFAGYEHAFGSSLSFRLRLTTYEFDTYIGTAGLSYRF